MEKENLKASGNEIEDLKKELESVKESSQFWYTKYNELYDKYNNLHGMLSHTIAITKLYNNDR